MQPTFPKEAYAAMMTALEQHGQHLRERLSGEQLRVELALIFDELKLIAARERDASQMAEDVYLLLADCVERQRNNPLFADDVAVMRRAMLEFFGPTQLKA